MADRNVLSLSFDPTDLGQVRWAISPAWELLASLRTIADPGRHAVHLPWLAEHRDDPFLTRPSIARDLTVGPSRRLPGFLAPTPDSPLTDLADELHDVARTPAEVVRRELRACFPDGLPDRLERLYRAPRRELPAAVDTLHAWWKRALAPSWPRLRALLEADVQRRARDLTERGLAALFERMHPTLTWQQRGSTLRIAHRFEPVEPRRTLDGRGLVLVPSAFAWPDVFTKTDPDWAPVLRYPALGVATLWEATPPSADLARALGAARARLLRLLDTPATTDQLARQTGLAAGGVSAQLHRLRDAGLVDAHRSGRLVLYARTERGEALLR